MEKEKIEITEKDVGKVVLIDESHPVVNPPSKFSVGQEIDLPDGKKGKIIEVRGTVEAGFSYAVAHGIHSEFKESELNGLKAR